MIEALIELQSASPERAKSFNCSTCPQRVKDLRRCKENRMDFTEKDGAFWPIQIEKGGGLYGFCPAKATWDAETVSILQALILADRTGANWCEGGIAEQPAWWVELASEFLPRIDEARFYSRARAILGDSKPTSGVTQGGNIKKRPRV